MTSSGAYVFNPVAQQIVTSALRKMGVISEDETPTAGQLSDGLFTLNAMMKELAATGIHVWTEQEAILFLEPFQTKYLIGPGSTDNTSDASAWNLLQTSQVSNAGANSVTLQTPIELVTGQPIGVVLNTGPTFWTTVSAVADNGLVLLGSSVPANVSAGNFVFTYLVPIIRPLKVPKARRLAYNGLIEIPMIDLSRQEYMDLPNKQSPGIPTQFFYSPQLNQGAFYVWPAPQDSSSAIRFTWYRPLQDFTNQINTADLPQEWVNTLIWCLCKEWGLDFDVPPQRWGIIIKMAEEKLDMVEGWDRETEPVLFSMNYDETQR